MYVYCSLFMQFEEDAFVLHSKREHLLHCDSLESYPANFENWQNYLQLLEVVYLLFAPTITEDEVGYLSVLIGYCTLTTGINTNRLANAPSMDHLSIKQEPL